MTTAGLAEVFSERARLQRYLDVEAALARTQSELGLIPASAGPAITRAARADRLDTDRIRREQAITGHLMVPIVGELSRAVGDPDGGWVHWGATTQNIQQTGDVLGFRIAHERICFQLCALLDSLADLGETSADMLMAGRTHWQHAVPITFGFKVAAWSDAMLRHLDRLHDLEPRLFTSMTGGAAGTFATLGEGGPAVQAGVAARLGLTPMPLPSRTLVDHFTEFVSVLAMISATAASAADEVARLGATEFGEANESLSDGDVGSSTMPQKRNAKACMTIVVASSRLRALVGIALESMIQSHEVDGARSAMIENATIDACVLADEVLRNLLAVVDGLELHPARMRANLDLTGGLITAEAVMMELGSIVGRNVAHGAVHHAAARVAESDYAMSFTEALAAEPLVAAHLTAEQIDALLDPAAHSGLSSRLARDTARRARVAAAEHRDRGASTPRS